MGDVDQAPRDTAPVWLAGTPLDVRVSELTREGMSEVDALLYLLEWAIRRRPLDEVEIMRSAVAPHEQDMSQVVIVDLRWLLGFAALQVGRYAYSLALLAPLSNAGQALDRPLGPHERGPQILASLLVAQVFRELGAEEDAREQARKSLDWLGDLGATDYVSCAAGAGQMWKGAHLIGFELEVGLAKDALDGRDLKRARGHAVAARRWLPRRVFDVDRVGGAVPWRYRIQLLLLWSKLSLARGRSTSALRNAEFALDLAKRHQALPDLARCYYQHGLALLGAPFDPVRYLLEPESRAPLPGPARFDYSFGLAAATAETAGMAELASAVHLTLGALFAPHDPTRTRLHIDRAMQLADRVTWELSPELLLWWELSRMAKLRLAHVAVHHERADHPLWVRATTTDSEPSAPHRDDNEEAQLMQGLDDIPQPPDLEGELRAALRHAGYALADETGAGAVIAPADDQVGLVVGWQPSPALDQIPATLSSGLVMKELPQILEALGFLARPYELDPERLIVKGTYTPMLAADEEDDGDRTTRWYDSETEARHAQLRWVANTRIYDVPEMRNGLAGHPLRDLVVRILIALDTVGLPLLVDQPNDGFGSGIDIAVFPHATRGSHVTVSWEPQSGRISTYQREVCRTATRTLIERVLNAAGIITSGHVTDSSVYVFAQPQELTMEPTGSHGP
ncbi:MAG: hypothetical protein ACRDT0_20840 [Pseudonocardiaceae bacterium]